MKSSSKSWIALDFISLFLTWLPGCLMVAAVIEWAHFIYSIWGWNFQSASFLILTPVIAIGVFLPIVFLIRLSLPKLRAGIFPIGFNSGFVAWYCHLALSRAASVFGVRGLIQCTYLTRFFYWRALGARVSINVHSSFTIDLVDAPLISIGEGTTLADFVKVSAHTLTENRLYLAPVSIEKNSFISKSVGVDRFNRLEKRRSVSG
jgi:hypothetical protein